MESSETSLSPDLHAVTDDNRLRSVFSHHAGIESFQFPIVLCKKRRQTAIDIERMGTDHNALHLCGDQCNDAREEVGFCPLDITMDQIHSVIVAHQCGDKT